MSSMLELTDVRAGYGSAEVLHGISVTVDEGEVAVILGANGVGKTTMLRSIAVCFVRGRAVSALVGRSLTVWARRRSFGLAWAWCPGRRASSAT